MNPPEQQRLRALETLQTRHDRPIDTILVDIVMETAKRREQETFRTDPGVFQAVLTRCKTGALPYQPQEKQDHGPGTEFMPTTNHNSRSETSIWF